MKQIVEEWKVIEEFPHHEISNFGRCRNTKLNRIASKRIIESGEPKTKYFGFKVKSENGFIYKSVGLLVAKHFVPNPNGYNHIIFKDHDTSNHMYTNIEWIPIHKNVKKTRGNRKSYIKKEIQLATIRREIQLLSDMEKYIQEDRIPEFVYEKMLPILKIRLNYLFIRYPNDHREEFIDYMIDYLIDFIGRGNLIFNFGFGLLRNQYKKFIKKYPQTVQLNEQIKYNYGNTDNY
jgi:hypothetical protein